MNIETILAQYIATALWSTNDESDERGGEPLDYNYDRSDLAPDTVAKMRQDVINFVDYAGVLLVESGLDDEAIGHNFWLTRNGHGCGFWDCGLGAVGKSLTKACDSFGSADLYVGDDGLIYLG